MTTKLKVLMFVLAVFSCGTTFAQKHLPESKTLIGLWRQAVVVRTQQGENVHVKTVNYKVVNPDGTFYSFITWGSNSQNPQGDVTAMNMYGTYTITSDSTFTEHIIKHGGNPQMNNSESELKYKFIPESDNEIMYMMYKNTATNQWIPEMWQRVSFPETADGLQQQVL